MSDLQTETPFPDDAAIAAREAGRINQRAGYRRFSNQIVGAVLFVLTLVTGVTTMMGQSWDIGIAENKTPTALPPLSRETLNNRLAFTQISDWAADTFSTKRAGVYGMNALRWYGFKSSNDPQARVGKDGWFFYGGVSMTRDYERSEGGVFEGGYKNEIRVWMKEIEAWGEEQGIRVVFVVAPNKHTIYPEHMPDTLKRADIPANVRLVEDLAQATAPSIAVAMTDDLIAAKADGQTYYKIDTHWNYQGGLIGMRSIARTLESGPRAVELVPEPQWTTESYIESPGNFGQLMGLPFEEEGQKPVPVGGWTIDRVRLSEVEETLLPNPTRALNVYENTAAPDGPVALMLGDSFMEGMLEPLAARFGKMYSMNLWSTRNTPTNRFPIRLIREIDPDVLIIEIVERRLRACNRGECRAQLKGDLPTSVRKRRLEQLTEASNRAPLQLTTRVPAEDRIILPLDAAVPESHEVVLELRVPEGIRGRVRRVSREPDHLSGEMTTIRLSGGVAPQYVVAVLNGDRDGISLRTEDVSEEDLATFDFTAYLVPREAF
ncbi:MAG: hypothetical protein AAFR74_05230 [Pseudomonadota bacterium]